MPTMTEQLQHAAGEIQKQVREGLKPDVGSLVLLLHSEGLGCATNISKAALARSLRALLEKVENGRTGEIILPDGGIYTGRN
jgi:hypothetical protein